MQIKAPYLPWITILLIPLTIASITYGLELIVIPDRALLYSSYWFGYIIYYIIFRLIFFLPALIAYPYIFKKRTKRNKVLGLFYAIFCGLFYSLIVFSNDLRIALYVSDKFLMSISYSFTAVIIYYIYENLGENRKTDLLRWFLKLDK
jgi:hypothetical protein